MRIFTLTESSESMRPALPQKFESSDVSFTPGFSPVTLSIEDEEPF